MHTGLLVKSFSWRGCTSEKHTRRGWATAEDVLNTRSAEDVLRWKAERRKA